MDIDERITEEELNLEEIDNNQLIESYKQAESFLKLVDDEIKKTDIGDSDE